MKTKDFLYLGYPIILFIYISIFNFGLLSCSSEGCSISNNLLIFSKETINYLGTIFSISLFFIYLVFKYSKKEFFISLYRNILFSALIFETIIFIYQLKNNIFCPYCLGVFSSLWFFSFFALKDRLITLIIFLVSISIAIFSINTSFSNDSIKEDITLITSKTCSHCKKVKEEFSKQQIKYQEIEAEKSSLLTTMNINTVPVLIKKESYGYRIIKGEKQILDEFKQESTNNDFLNSFYQENTESCSIKAEKTCN